MSEAREEDRIVRNAIPAIYAAFPGALVMRNEANALTAFKQLALVLLGEAKLPAFALRAAKASVNEAYNQTSTIVRYGLGIGSADVIVCHLGRFIALEFKSVKGAQSDVQACWQGWVTRAGGLYFIVRSVDEAISAVASVLPS